ncbi:MAG: 16S rRNA (uracil(1498)-N(3))-methyltransferase [Saprospiraceae bacterium]|jgi:16S rRNA (uracil1498-N3)-methyltransferase|nr:16S rRNA (uracil(1498)-N(3))-methyltransferase [Saprospiraceae bacterium]
MIIFYSTDVRGNLVYIKGEEHIHCTKVLRNKEGDTINVTDGRGKLYICRIEKISKSETSCFITGVDERMESDAKCAIAISPLKNPSRLEWFVEKAVEIGISEIYIFNSKRTERKSVNRDRLDKIIISAMKQSMNICLPYITFVNNFSDIFISIAKYEGKYIARCESDPPLLTEIRSKQGSNIVLIGPEGDFTKDEADHAISHGFTVVSLGPSRLRTETAGIVALSMLKY